MSTEFDIAVLGGGPGGYVAALKAGQMGARVAIIEKSHLGGTCLNNGCIPSKALLASAELAHHIGHAADLGLEVAGQVGINWEKIQCRKDKIIAGLRGGIKALLGARKVTVFPGTGTLAGPGKINIAGTSNGTQQIAAGKTILATGSTPARIPGWPTDANIVCTSDEALHWKTLPKRLLIVGGGVIGCEFACMMQALGVHVTIVEMLPQLLPNVDTQLAEALGKTFAKRGIKVLVGAKIESMVLADGGAKATLGDGQAILADRVLVATGRRPATADLGLESIGLTTERGFIRVNQRMETTVGGYYCIGDANGRCLLAHAASAQGIAAVENALGHGRDFDAPIPNCIYTFPELAAVGMTAQEAQAKGVAVAVGVFPLSHLGKAMAVGDTEGMVKVVRDRQSGALLGVHMMGHNVTECIAAAGAMLHQKVKVADLAEVVFAHPTISESIKEAAEDALFMGLHLPPRKVMQVMATVAG